ncbi:MAG: hypothetical protein ACE5H3_08445 [Planctomycetota bacterium]
MYPRLPWLLLLALGACQASPPQRSHSAASVLADWGDLPVPRGFHLVEDPASGPVMEAGHFRFADLLFEGRGAPGTIEAYYHARMPLSGWSWNAAEGFWGKGGNRVQLIISPYSAKGYRNSPHGVQRFLLKVRTQRSAQPPPSPRS